ncbi:MFS transporter [Kushneria phosphatilytica]|uniref:MFS transporter n=1 Tax=Kushneria phosphatilytica TaxID=657387 RepID=A0A1S1NW01_9GAMM|nr:MFS transporter [Kushneria phosphatilytica]OHV09346.1 arabinose ABC transporter permease [Kushneria phosphatilytica]QEL12310.1 MFS transporter [Kushneria phosphatilytica]
MSATTTKAVAGEPGESWLDRIGIPHSLRWGFLGVLIFMTGNGVESNFIAPHMTQALGEAGAPLVPTIIAMYSLAVLLASYLSGALADLFGPRRVMLLGFLIWVVFEVAFLWSLSIDSVVMVFVTYFMRGFGFPLFAFAFLVWINAVSPRSRNGAAVGWFYVMFTGGLPTLGSLFAVVSIPFFGGGSTGEVGSMWASTGLVTLGFLLAWFGVREPTGRQRLAPSGESASEVITSGLRLTFREPRVAMGFLVRLINTAPEFGMFVILPAVIADDLGWGQSRWLLMTTVVYAGNILFNAAFGTLGDRWGWTRTVRWFGVVGSAVGLLAWWYVPHMVPAGSDWGYFVSLAAGTVFGIMLAGFVPMGAIMPALVPEHKGAAMAMYTTAAGGAIFLGTAVVAVVQPLLGNVGVVWTFVALYASAFVMLHWLKVDQSDEAEMAEASSGHTGEVAYGNA